MSIPSQCPKVVCIPDSFKGSLSATEVAQAMAAGVRISAPGAEVSALGFADGGEGSLEVFCTHWDTPALGTSAVDALGRDIQADYGISPDGKTAVIEAAQANGLPQVSDQPLQPLRASSYGVGLLAAAALNQGVDEVLLCLGGSATTDGGLGMLSGLGISFYDHDGEVVETPAQLPRLARIETSGLHPRARQVRWRIAADVSNPLLGDTGAAAVFGPQKGAGPVDVEQLEAGLRRFAQLCAEHGNLEFAEFSQRPALGAAGGIPAGLTALLGAELVSGSELVAQTLDLAGTLAGADLVLTGEGRLDSQSLDGKVISVISRYAPEDAQVIAVAGSVELDVGQCHQAGLSAAFSIAPGPASLKDLQDQAAELLSATCAQITALVLAVGTARG